jgi:hypothetical protein
MSSDALTALVRDAFESMIREVHTCIVGTVITYNLTDNRADIQPTVKGRDSGGVVRSKTPLRNVPVLFPSTNTSAIVFPLQSGDPVLVIMSERSLDAWKASSTGQVDPQDLRYMSLDDAIAIPGVFPFASSIANPSKHALTRTLDDLTITHNLGASGREAQIRLKRNGTMEINCGSTTNIVLNQDGTVEINAPSKLTINADILLEVNAPQTDWNGNITHIGNVLQTGDTTRTGNLTNVGLISALGIGIGATPTTGQIDLVGDVAITGSVTANGKTIDDTHTHSGVQAGAGNTGAVN